MEHFAPFTPNNSRISIIDSLVENAILQRNYGSEEYLALNNSGNPNLDDPCELPGSYPYTELPTRPATGSPVNNQFRPPNRPQPGLASPSLDTPFDSTGGFWSPPQNTPQTNQGSRSRGRRFRPVESSEFLPEYVIDNYLKANPGKDGFFCVFRKTYVLRSDGRTPFDGFVLPVNQTTLWRADQVFGHLFEVTTWGALVYHGEFQDNDRDFLSYWSQKSVLKELKAPDCEDESHAFFIPNSLTANGSRNLRTEYLLLLEAMPLALSSAKTQLNVTSSGIFIPLKGSELARATATGKDSGTWRRLFNLPGYKLGSHDLRPLANLDRKGHWLLYINFPKLIAQIVASAKCQPQLICKHISQGDSISSQLAEYEANGSVKCYFNYFYPSIKLRIPLIEYKNHGWMYTELPSMDVLVS
ncbi:hypothetical protein TWF694_007480 [Orbilia ellipsospora]|uniref:Uncharacterized protein n=1 Tax=Orbilia ellipsospora TaxID=2528407 RepID=A0AAV9XL91_9PEZI